MNLTHILEEILLELGTRDKEMIGQGKEHDVYPSLDPTKVIKVGEVKYMNKWIPMFKKHPDLFPIVYRQGLTKDPEVGYVVLERLNTKRFLEDYIKLDYALQDMKFHTGVYGAIKIARNNEKQYDKIIDGINEVNPDMSEFFIKLVDNVTAVDKLLPWHKPFDYHENQFGYDRNKNVKCLDV